jgi:hypothetical protein
MYAGNFYSSSKLAHSHTDTLMFVENMRCRQICLRLSMQLKLKKQKQSWVHMWQVNDVLEMETQDRSYDPQHLITKKRK